MPDVIVDGHCHIASTDFIPMSFIDGVVLNIVTRMEALGLGRQTTRVRSLYEATLCDHEGDQLVASMDAARVQQAVLLLPDLTYALRDTSLTIAEMIERHSRIMERHPGRFRTLCGIDPRWGITGVDLFERSITTNGCSGLKVYPPCGIRPDSRLLYPYYEICQTRRLPVIVHIGPTSPVLAFAPAHPSFLDRPARDFPDLAFVLAHGGVNHQTEAVAMCAYRPNVFLDLGGFPVMATAGGHSNGLMRLLSQGINHKIIFGTDWPVFSIQSTYAQLVAEATGADGPMSQCARAQRQWVLGGNMTRLLARSQGHADKARVTDDVA